MSAYFPQKKTKSVEVAEYVLPKFDVTIDSPAHFSAKDHKLRAIIRAKYTYGKFVKGEALVSLTQYGHYWSDYSSRRGDTTFKTIKVDGKGAVEFDIESDILPEYNSYQTYLTYKLEATVIEELTGEFKIIVKRPCFDNETFCC